MSDLSRRSLLTAAAVSSLGGLAGCSLLRPHPGPGGVAVPAAGSEADEVTGTFSWRRCEGSEITVLLVGHVYTDALITDLAAFRELTGITVRALVVEEAEYFDRVTIELVSGLPAVDVFMTGAYMVWQYGPPGWLENLDPWVASASATSPDYDIDDILPNLQDALRWDFTLGEPVGAGGRWAMPFGWESNVLAYRADLFDRMGLKPPQDLGQLEDVARAAGEGLRREGVHDGYGLAVRGSRSWATVHPGFMTQLTREGGRDFVVRDGHVAPVLDSAVSVAFHSRWTELIRDAGAPDWSDYVYQRCASDLGAGTAAMMYDATSAGNPVNRPGASAQSGNIAWSPGPAGPGGDLSSNLWVWSLAMSAHSQRKTPAWLFLQWATGRDHLYRAALGNHSDPVRRSILTDPAYRDRMAVHRGYLDTVDAVADVTRITFTPQPYFFDATTAWAGALQQMHAGADVAATLADLVDRLRRRD